MKNVLISLACITGVVVVLTAVFNVLVAMLSMVLGTTIATIVANVLTLGIGLWAINELETRHARTTCARPARTTVVVAKPLRIGTRA